jgi:hypothetical protein
VFGRSEIGPELGPTTAGKTQRETAGSKSVPCTPGILSALRDADALFDQQLSSHAQCQQPAPSLQMIRVTAGQKAGALTRYRNR